MQKTACLVLIGNDVIGYYRSNVNKTFTTENNKQPQATATVESCLPAGDESTIALAAECLLQFSACTRFLQGFDGLFTVGLGQRFFDG